MVVKPKNIDEYLAALSDDKRAALERLRKIIRDAVPKAEECISYQLPAFRLDGKCFVWFGAAREITARFMACWATTRTNSLDRGERGSKQQSRKPLLRSNRSALPHRRPAVLFSVTIFVRRGRRVPLCAV
jgi:hypothetical protein